MSEPIDLDAIRERAEKYRTEAHLLTGERDAAEAEVERLRTALARLVGSAHPYDDTGIVTVSVPFLEAAREALGTTGNEEEA